MAGCCVYGNVAVGSVIEGECIYQLNSQGLCSVELNNRPGSGSDVSHLNSALC